MNGAQFFVTRNGEEKFGYLVKMYRAFEGDMRYIFRCEDDGKDYRCVKCADGSFKEFVA